MRRVARFLSRFWGIPSLLCVDIVLIVMGAWWAALIASAGTLLFLVIIGGALIYRHFANPS
jgi:hypothetical protein